jgi:uncharacterized phage-like protein YoqJ
VKVLVSGPSKWNKKVTQHPERAEIAKEWLDAQLHLLSDKATETEERLEVGSSLHLGLDTAFAFLAVDRNLPLTAVIACNEQDKYWDDGKKENFQTLLSSAEKVSKVCPAHYEQGCIQKQSDLLTDWLLDDSSPTLLLLREKKLSKLQEDRVEKVKAAGGEIKLFRW